MKPLRLLDKAIQLYNLHYRTRFRFSRRSLPLRGQDGRLVGYVDRMEFARDQLAIVGWTLPGEITVTARPTVARLRPTIDRPDVVDVIKGASLKAGFEVKMAYRVSGEDGGSPISIAWHGDDGGTAATQVALCGRWSVALKNGTVTLRYFWMMLRLGRTIGRYIAQEDKVSEGLIVAAFGITGRSTLTVGIDPDLFEQPSVESGRDRGGGLAAALMGAEAASNDEQIAVIVPVYNGHHVLVECLDRLARHTDLSAHFIVIDDHSSDQRIWPLLEGWAEQTRSVTTHRVSLLQNPVNLGFVRTVNRAFSMIVGDDVHAVILNTDAFVPVGWASRLIEPIRRNPEVASVTPLSNDAEIMSVPAISQGIQLEPGECDLLDACAARFNLASAEAILPTGIGFCMAINKHHLRKVCEFDPIFNRGYGEEVDWCQKAIAAGGVNVGIGNLFVEHHSGVSFGRETKMELVRINGRIINERYPDYERRVHQFITDDPLLTARLALGIKLAALRDGGERVPIFLAHGLGGGAEMFLKRHLRNVLARTPFAVVLRVGGKLRWTVELHQRSHVTVGSTDDFALVERLLEPIERRAIHYSCGVGDRNGVELPDRLLALAREPADVGTVFVHDYFMVSPCYTLLGDTGEYAGVPEESSPLRVHQTIGANREVVTLSAWRASWRRLLHAAHAVEVFSESSRTIMLAAYPEIDAKIRVRPHRIDPAVRPVADRGPARPGLRPNGRAAVGILGRIGYQKGAAVVSDLGRHLDKDRRARLVVFGEVDGRFRVGRSTLVHGEYTPGEITDLAERYGIRAWLIPSIWPETFSFTTHEALATGLPVFCFDLGAQGEACRAHPNGRILSSREPDRILGEILREIVPLAA